MTDLTGVEVGNASKADAKELLGLINSIQPHVPWDERLLSWQFFEGPAGPARLWVIRDGSSIVSLYVAVRQRIRVNKEQHTGWMVQDVMSHPAYRGRGFLHHLGQLCLDEITAAAESGYTFPNKLSEGSFRRIGWSELGSVPLRQAVTGRLGCRTTSTSTITEIERFTETQESIWNHADVGAGVHRDVPFLEWRYRKPAQVYRRYSIESDQGFLVLKLFDNGRDRVVHICDLVVRSAARELVPAALGFAAARATEERAGQVTAWLPTDHPYASAFDEAGLAIDGSCDRRVFVTGPVEKRPWHLSQGDSDVY